MNNSKKVWNVIAIVAIVIAVILGINLYNKNTSYANVVQNDNNKAFYEVVDRIQNSKIYLAKSMISKEARHGAKTLMEVWRETDLATCYLSMVPIESQEIENTEKFLNQVSEYSYTMANKCIDGQDLSDDEMDKIQELYNYANDLSNTLNEMITELNNGIIKWEDLKKNSEGSDISEVSNFNMVEQNFHEYSGLIYDGAFSEHITSSEKKGLTGDDIDEESAKQKVIEFIGKDNIKEISSLGYSENASIPEYNFSIKTSNEDNVSVSISKKGGHIVYMNSNRTVNTEVISQDEANEKGKEFLNNHGFQNMKETYYLKQDGIVTINYAYTQNNVIIYSDLIKVKVALDNGEVLGIETTGYLNNHTQRDTSKVKISKEDAKKTLNKDLQITSEGLAIIPTEYKTEILCYEFKGKVDDREFLVYINAENGREEDILVITNTPNGTLTK